jgi:hypothetical protein
MKIAILYTGELRTIEKTLDLFRKNILESNKDQVEFSVFCCIQPSSYGKDLNKVVFEQIIRDKMGSHCKSLQWFLRSDPLFNAYQQRELSNLESTLTSNWIEYLRNSGSMIEYYQLWISFQDMITYERKNRMKFDYILRFRADLIWNEPLDLSWINMTEKELKRRVLQFAGNFESNEILINQIMTTLMHPKTVKNVLEEPGAIYDSRGEKQILNKSDPTIFELLNLNYFDINFINGLVKFIHDGNYILTFRKNLIYFVARRNFDFIPYLGLTYGNYGSPETTGYYWFNAECQFRELCKKIGLSIFDYHSKYEERMMTDMDYNASILTERKEDLLFAIIRK